MFKNKKKTAKVSTELMPFENSLLFWMLNPNDQ